MDHERSLTRADRLSISGDGLRQNLQGRYALLERRERALWALAVLALLGDLLSTLAGLRAGLAESNPFVLAALSSGGVAGFIGLKVGAVAVAVAIRLLYPRYGPAIALGIGLPWLLATVNNVVLLVALA